MTLIMLCEPSLDKETAVVGSTFGEVEIKLDGSP